MNDLIKVKVYLQDRDTKKHRGFDDVFQGIGAVTRYLRDRMIWTNFRALVLIKGEKIESTDKEVN